MWPSAFLIVLSVTGQNIPGENNAGLKLTKIRVKVRVEVRFRVRAGVRH